MIYSAIKKCECGQLFFTEIHRDKQPSKKELVICPACRRTSKPYEWVDITNLIPWDIACGDLSWAEYV